MTCLRKVLLHTVIYYLHQKGTQIINRHYYFVFLPQTLPNKYKIHELEYHLLSCITLLIITLIVIHTARTYS